MQHPEQFTGDQILFTRSHIARFYNYSGDTSSVDTDILRDYNLGVESLARVRDKDPRRSIERLPNEILIAIIQKAAWVGYRGYHRELLVLTLVNHRWAQLILQTQSFWSRISLEENTEDLEAMTAVILELSGDCSLDLTYCAESDIIRKVAHLIQPHIHRVAHLQLLWQYHNPARNLTTDPFFPHTVFPSLREITTHYIPPESILLWFLHHKAWSPYNYVIEGDCFYINLKVREESLVSFHSNMLSMAAVQRLEDIMTLQDVGIFGPYEASGDSSIIIEERRHLLGWEKLFISNFPWKGVRGILGRCTALVSLTLMNIDKTATPELVEILSRLIFLEDLSIDLYGHTALETSAISSGHDNYKTRIRTINLSLTSDISNVEITGDILPLLLRMSPRLESLSLTRCRANKLDFAEIDKLKDLRKLQLDGCESTFEPNTTRHILACPKLEMVWIAGSIDALNSLGSTSTSKLDYGPLMMESSPIIEITGRDWPSLRSLSLHMNSVMVYGLDALRQLSLSRQPLVTDMIHYLAMHPNELPLLETLILQTCPEWDILFILLEKRLLTQTQGVKPIENLIFHRLIPKRIKHSLALLLAGHVVSRPSNYELSMQGNLGIFLDADIPGCVECHRYLYPCELKVLHTSPVWSEPTIDYPSGVDEILRTWDIRYVQVEHIYNPGYDLSHRKFDCGRFGGLLEVSRYSAEDCLLFKQ
ncbi:SubName: Full=Uncharacterized protein {ECO:0000313/EMBL:CCA75980.1} [Serendipita indica DSM 11827]|nr:SubName: Full=Uncharacterized protein {ECO:0000313/EMBL:CCA75980.1} [Serendipita indica DSM 11827]